MQHVLTGPLAPYSFSGGLALVALSCRPMPARVRSTRETFAQTRDYQHVNTVFFNPGLSLQDGAGAQSGGHVWQGDRIPGKGDSMLVEGP